MEAAHGATTQKTAIFEQNGLCNAITTKQRSIVHEEGITDYCGVVSYED
jgi:hypothetical protein